MASTIQTPNGPYIVIPQNNIQGMNTGTSQRGMFHQEFLKGQPKALGVVQIMVAFMYIFLGIIVTFTTNSFVSISTYSGISFWGALFYIISGSLCIATENGNSVSLVQASLAMNIISSLVSLAAMALYSTDIAYYYPNYYPSCSEYECFMYRDNAYLLRELALSFLLTASILEFCIAVSVSSFGCRSLEKRDVNPPQVFMLRNDQNAAMNPLQFANVYQSPLDQNINTLDARNFRQTPVPTTIPEVNSTYPLYPSMAGGQ